MPPPGTMRRFGGRGRVLGLEEDDDEDGVSGLGGWAPVGG